MVTDGGFSSMSILARRAARRASSRVRATTANSAWPWNMTSSSANSGSSANTGAMSFLPGMSGAVRTATTPGAARTALQIKALQPAAGLVGHADRDMQRSRGLADVVDIGRRALNMQAGGIVRQRLVDDRGREVEFGSRHSAAWSTPIRVGALAPEISISAFSSRLAATVMR